MHPVMQALSPRHLAVQVRPLRQLGSSARQALAWRLHLSTRQVWSTRDVSKPLPPYLAESSFSAAAGDEMPRMRDAERAAVARPVPRTRPASSSNVGGDDDDDEAACSSFFVIMRKLRTREERAEAEVSGRKAWQVEAAMTTAMAATRRERLLLLMVFEDEVEGAIAFVSELRVVARLLIRLAPTDIVTTERIKPTRLLLAFQKIWRQRKR
mmetsp:Transcript_16147/g.38540  ORF Transcript_16147/g.38540 Transcript_16147/m.38540 type:complete len:211 (-) Transcript_16147:37-669(-)